MQSANYYLTIAIHCTYKLATTWLPLTEVNLVTSRTALHENMAVNTVPTICLQRSGPFRNIFSDKDIKNQKEGYWNL